MHIDYVNEVIEYQRKIGNSEQQMLEFLCNDEFVDFAAKSEDGKISGIAKDMQKCKEYRNGQDTRKRMTSKQKYAIANYLLTKYSNIENVVKEVFAA
jgi:hypothetical protein